MAGIFISYRRADSDGWAGRLRDALRVRFGELVFQDVDNIPDGEIFSDVIDRALRECDVALIIIGPNWASARDEHGVRRLDHEDDWVRTETAMVLNRTIRVASAEGLILLKLLAFRSQDVVDIENLVAVHRRTLDLVWIRSEWQTVAGIDDPRRISP